MLVIECSTQKLKITNIFKTKNYQMQVVFWNIIVVVIGLIALTFIYVFKFRLPSLFYGWLLGNIFSLISFLSIKYSVIILFATKNKYWTWLGLFIRLILYAIPVIISAEFNNIFNLYTTLSGLLVVLMIVFIKEIITAIKYLINQRKIKKNE